MNNLIVGYFIPPSVLFNVVYSVIYISVTCSYYTHICSYYCVGVYDVATQNSLTPESQ